jgi:hypothetical protein
LWLSKTKSILDKAKAWHWCFIALQL